jgi:hypothetical protein
MAALLQPRRGFCLAFALGGVLVYVASVRPASAADVRGASFCDALLDAILRRDGLSGNKQWSGRSVAYEVLFDLRSLCDGFGVCDIERFVQSKFPRIVTASKSASQRAGAAVDMLGHFGRLCHASPIVAAEVYDGTLKRALFFHFIKKDFSAALALYSDASYMAEQVVAAANEADLVPSPARSSTYRVWFSALSREGGLAGHHQGMAQLMELAKDESTAWKRPSKKIRAIPRWVGTRTPVFEVDSTSQVLVDRWTQDIIQQSLVADIWCDDGESEPLYQLADTLLQTKARLSLTTMQRLGERTDNDQSGLSLPDARQVVMRSWLEPGFIAIYSATLTEALRDAYYSQDVKSASYKLAVLLRLSHGLEGSASLDHQSAIEKVQSRLAACGSDH